MIFLLHSIASGKNFIFSTTYQFVIGIGKIPINIIIILNPNYLIVRNGNREIYRRK